MAKATVSPVLFIRSAATDWDRSGRLSGQVDHPPIPEDVTSVLSAALPGVSGAFALVSGPEASCREVAQGLAHVSGRRIKVEKDLHEVGVGLWEGMLRSELQARYPSCWESFTDDPYSMIFPEGETIPDALARIRTRLAKILAKRDTDDGPLVVVLRPLLWAITLDWALGSTSPGVERLRSGEDGVITANLPHNDLKPSKSDRSSVTRLAS